MTMTLAQIVNDTTPRCNERITRAGIATIRPLAERDVEPLSVLVAIAFANRQGHIPSPYHPAAVRDRLMWSLDSAGKGGPVTQVADIDGQPAGLGQYAPCRWAQMTWEMMLGAVWPEMQGQGIGHALVLARLSSIAQSGGGMVLVSARKPERWLRYGFAALTTNTATGCTMLARQVMGERA